jgi:hypothetical protein
MELKPDFWTPEIPYARSDHLPLSIKERGMVKVDKGALLHSWGHAVGRGRVYLQPSLESRLSYRFK